MTEMNIITVYGDFNCPFSYALNERLHVHARDTKIRWRAVQHVPNVGSQLPSFEEQAQLTAEVSSVRKRAPEVHIVTPESRPNSLAASRLLTAAQNRDLPGADSLRLLLFRALWRHSRDISDPTVLDELVGEAGMALFDADTEDDARLEEWQQIWEWGDFDRRIPAMESEAGGSILGFPAIPRLIPFLQGQVEEEVRLAPTGDYLSRRRVLVVGEDIGLVTPVASEFDIDKAHFEDDLETLSLEAGEVDLIILDGMDDRHRPLCVRLQAGELTQHIPVVIYNQCADARKEVEAFNLGALDYMHGEQDPVVWLARSRGLARHKQSTDRLGKLARIDGLTEIPNRREFDRMLEIEWLRATRSGSPLSLLILDVDNFKLYNDGYGHDAGDECLRQVAMTIQGTMRRGADFAARYGGEEFACVLPDTDRDGAIALADAIRGNIEALNIPHGHGNADRIVTISTGVATLRASSQQSPVELIKASDGALYLAKESGRNCVRAA
jgi:diguanylate cyclase (GGDEF)-like protein